MKLYEQKVFKLNGFTINGVYVVKPRDTLTNILKVTKKFGVKPDDLEKINPLLKKGLAPGQFVYFTTKQPRFADQAQLVLNHYELERSPYSLLEVESQSDFKALIDKKMGYPNAWEHVFLVNKMSLQKFKELPGYSFKIYKSDSEVAFKESAPQKSFDNFLVNNQEPVDEKQIESLARRTPASEVVASNSQGTGVTFGVIVVVLTFALFLYYKKRTKKFIN